VATYRRSGLLETRSGVSMLASIVGALKLVSGRYDFLISCTRLFEALAEDFVANVVNRKARGKSAADLPLEMHQQPVCRINCIKSLLTFARYFTDVFEACSTGNLRIRRL